MDKYNLKHSFSRWKVPGVVSNPNIEDDIRILLSDNILQKYLNYEGNSEDDTNAKKHQIVRITEMLDLCNHLNCLKIFLSKINKPKQVGDVLHDNISFEGHDFSGCPYDIEALILYLYISIIDTYAGQSQYYRISEYMNNEIDENELNQNGKKYILNLCNDYEDKYGLSKNFKKVFTSDISFELKKEISDNILILSQKRKTPYSFDEIEQKFLEWMDIPVDKRIKSIAECIYNLRSMYTHKSIRSFIPSIYWNPNNQPINEQLQMLLTKYNIKGYIIDEKIKFHFISTIQTDLFSLLKRVIVECCNKILS